MRRGSICLIAALVVAGCSSASSRSVTLEPAGQSATRSARPSTAHLPTPSTSNVPPVATPSTVAGPLPSPAPSPPSVSVADGDRPFDVFVPSSYDGSTPVPLVVVLHGYTATGASQEEYFLVEPVAEARGFLYVHPDGTTDSRGFQFWNATDACCNFDGSTVDDSTYLIELIGQVQAQYRVDPKRIFLVGHSNGGFMSYRMACDHAGTIAAVVSLAGATWADPAMCAPAEPVSVLQIHGTDDRVIAYDGGNISGPAYPSAPITAATWAAYASCSPTAQASSTRYDVVSTIEGSETSSMSFTGCPQGIDVELRTIDNGSHVPVLSPTFADQVVEFLLAHPKP